MEALDTEIGRLLGSLDPAVRANTMVIFLADNGTPSTQLGQPLGKGTLAESGINVPLIVTGPLVPAPSRNTVSSAMVNTTYLYATIAAIAGVDLDIVLPAGRRIDSFSLLPLLADPAGASIRPYAYSEQFKPNGPPPHDLRREMIRDERWKLVRHRAPRKSDQFYDLEAAPPGRDGEDLCPCPDGLEGDRRAGFRKLVAEIDRLHATENVRVRPAARPDRLSQ